MDGIPQSECSNERNGKGRRKIEIKKIKSQARRHVTFSKLRTGLMNKASKLSILTGAGVAIITISPGGKVYCFDSGSIVDRYLHNTPMIDYSSKFLEERNRYMEKKMELEEEMKREKLSRVWPELEGGRKMLWEISGKDMSIEEKKKILISLKNMRERVKNLLKKKFEGENSTFLGSEMVMVSPSPMHNVIQSPLKMVEPMTTISQEMIKKYISNYL